jgi:hypothetical protein
MPTRTITIKRIVRFILFVSCHIFYDMNFDDWQADAGYAMMEA